MTSTYQPRRSKGVLLATEFRRFTPMHVGTVAFSSGSSPHSAVHPHARGDDRRFTFCSRHLFGSPPRAWGRCRRSSRWWYARSAVHPHARGDHGRAQDDQWPPVHPHARGDHGHVQRFYSPGSPPRAWGRRYAAGLPLSRRCRFTPTRVGTARLRGVPVVRGAVHPHARGDDQFRTSRLERTVHPHARGDHSSRFLSRFALARFTPTRVGTTLTRSSRGTRRRFTPTRVGTTGLRIVSHCVVCRFTPTRVGTTATGVRRRRRRDPVHPHARGDDAAVSPVRIVRRDGSPPRAWGRRCASVPDRRRRSVHPHARGDDESPMGLPITHAVHPHARGDDCTSGPSSRRCSDGSPPRAWGRRVPCSRHRPIASGSPPRAWGRLIATSPSCRHCRFTPTRVGTTSRCALDRRPVAGSPPRAWGRRAVTVVTRESARGSPPRAWGRLGYAVDAVRANAVHPHARGDDGPATSACLSQHRFTPTRVGTTASSRRVATPRSVHPHARGDDELIRIAWQPSRPVHPHARGDRLAVHRAITRCVRGSPPRAWGRRAVDARCAARDRFTPTRVGTTRLLRLVDASSQPVHPHARGDNDLSTADGEPCAGSPPRAWGQRRQSVLAPGHGSPPRAWGQTSPRLPSCVARGSPPRAWGHSRRRRVERGFGSPPRAWGQR